MKRYRFFGQDAELSHVAQLIMSEDIPSLEASIEIDWYINAPFEYTEHSINLAINLALVENKLKVLDYLLEKGADLNFTGSPVISYAVRNCDIETIEKLLSAGADIGALSNVGSNAYSCAVYSERLDVLHFLFEQGLPIQSGGSAFLSAIMANHIEMVEFFLSNGLDISKPVKDMVHPYAPSPLMVAMQSKNLELIKLLLDNGADPTICDEQGDRPFTLALYDKNVELEKLFRRYEPDKWHSRSEKVRVLHAHGVPNELTDTLKNDKRRVELPDCEECRFIEFHRLENVFLTQYEGSTYPSLLVDVDDYHPTGFLVWLPEQQALGTIDFEHDDLIVLGTWDEFKLSPSTVIARQWI